MGGGAEELVDLYLRQGHFRVSESSELEWNWNSALRYYHGRCLDELHPLIPPAQTFTARTPSAMFMVANHPSG